MDETIELSAGASVSAKDEDGKTSRRPVTERQLADVLSEVMGGREVDPADHFFDDLGADSMVLAHFCARMKKHDDLPLVPIKEVYTNPTIELLAAALNGPGSDGDGAPDETGPAPVTSAAEPAVSPLGAQLAAEAARAEHIRGWRYLRCGLLQLLTYLGVTFVTAVVLAAAYEWTSAASGIASTYYRAVVYGGVTFAVLAVLPIPVKWLLVGRWKPGQFPIWSLAYFRFWLVKVAIQSSPLTLFIGTPIYSSYLRALGAKIGRNVVILSPSVPVCTDLLTIGDDTVIRKDSTFTCYRALSGVIQTGPVTVGSGAFVGELTVLDIHTTVGDGAQIGHASALDAGQSVPAGHHRIGTPAHHATTVDYRAVAPVRRSRPRRIVYSLVALAFLFVVSLPLGIVIFSALGEWRITGSVAALGADGSLPFSNPDFYRDVVLLSLALFAGLTILRLLFVTTVPRLFNRVIRPGRAYPLYGVRYIAHRAVTRLTNVTFFTNLFGDSSYIVHYLRLLGYKVTTAEQTGANFGLNVKHDNPYHISVGPGTMAADGLSLVNAEYSSTSFRLTPVEIGAHSFLGNNIAYPSAGVTGENCLHASKVTVPVEGEVREGVGFLGSPSFEIPRNVLRDRKFGDLRHGPQFPERLAAKNRHNRRTIAWFLLSRWVAWLGATFLVVGAAELYSRYGELTIFTIALGSVVVGTLYFAVVEWAGAGFKALNPLYCSMYDLDSWRIERFWKLSWQPALFNGTPFKPVAWRLLGVKMGKRVYDDGAILVEKTMITVGDDSAFNVGSVIQPHSQEDGAFKSDYVSLGDRCTLGVGALVHYGVTMGDDASLGANAFLMKGSEVAAGTHWGENPARELAESTRLEPGEVAVEPDAQAQLTAPRWLAAWAAELSPGAPRQGNGRSSGVEVVSDPKPEPVGVDGGGNGRSAGVEVVSEPKPEPVGVDGGGNGRSAGVEVVSDPKPEPVGVDGGGNGRSAAVEVVSEPEPEPEPVQPTGADTNGSSVSTGGIDAVTPEADASSQYWRQVLLSGGKTTVPRWTAFTAEHEVALSDDLITALSRLAAELDVTLGSVLLAGHARVLTALAGEREVVTGYVTTAAWQPLPCRLTMEPGSWRELIQRAHEVESAVLDHASFPINQLRRELGMAEPMFETVFDAAGQGGELTEGVALRVEVSINDGQHRLRLRYRIDALEADAASRIGGYHLAALEQLIADPDADPAAQSLLSDDELEYQVEGLAGPDRPLPDQRFHRLFEDRVRTNPDTVAAVYGDQRWTYGELNARANRLGRALRARGLEREGIVAVVTERNLDWMASVLAVLKAGGVYLPVEPHFPPDRIAAMLARSECALALTEAASRATLDQALASVPPVDVIDIEAAYGAELADGDLDIEVTRDQLAYIYFTSGSTGEPKGAMCEHHGMLNHLYAKVDDLEIADREAVAQIAPQCFDISLWQLLSALLVGGRTVVIDQDTILDPQRFLDTIVDGEVAVMQVVPSYLEVLLSSLERQPRDLAALHCVSVTGEALTFELTQRWFASQPGIKLANAYGLTETSDDTNHEVMDRPPPDGRVALGAAVNNVRVYVVDEHLTPVPLGAPGEIVFSGICVGRGYINDPERTGLAYVDDPLRRGERLYRSGDFGRWRPDGKLEYLGRRDAQVKIRGFRIEIGEIENTLLQLPGVRNGAVVVAERDGSKQLVAFYSGDELDTGQLQDRLSASLPHYMVPAAFHWREDLPLTDNGKINRKILTAQASELDTVSDGGEVDQPSTPAEQQLAAAWAAILGVPADQIGRSDNFFDRGGTSLSAVELVIALDSAVSLKEVTRHPVLADLAQLIDGGPREPQAGILQLLSETDSGQDGALVCFPYAGGNAVNYQAMARELRDSQLAVYAAELPGHDLGAASEPFVSIDDVVERVVLEIVERDLGPVVLWGHSSGAPFALRAALELEAVGAELQQVFIGAQLLGTAEARRAHLAELDAQSDAELAGWLSADNGYSELGQLDAERAARTGAAYRHDCTSAHHALLDALDTPPATKLSAPVTVVVAADDPATEGWAQHYRDWEILADDVQGYELADGGHYFLRTRPAEAAAVVLRASATSSPPTSTTPPPPAASLDPEAQPGSPPLLMVDADRDPADWVAEQREAIRAAVAEHGAAQIRGLDLSTTDAVSAVANQLATGLMTEKEAFASREAYDGGVYSSSTWPPNQQMCMHHELSYRLEVPGLMVFGCLAAPSTGGAIAVADGPTVLEALPPDLVARFEREGWTLIRNYTDEIGLSAGEAFGTEDSAEIERYCRANAIDYEWSDGGALRTWQRRSAIVHHPVTGQRCWFNQIAFLNEWTMNPEVRELLVDMYGGDGLPFTTRFGNGDPIGEDVVRTINDVYEANTARVVLQAGDLVLVDNIRTAHSREPYEGQRDVVVGLGDAVRLADLSPTVEVASG